MFRTLKKIFIPILLSAVAVHSSCAKKEAFPEIGTKFASPIDAAVSSDGNYFYVLNSDFDREYDTGSLVVLDSDGEKLSALKIPRLARTLTISGTDQGQRCRLWLEGLKRSVQQ